MTSCRDPAWQQMAIDRALVDHAAARRHHRCYRLYRWAGDTVSFGANEAARRTWDRERLERARTPLCPPADRRPRRLARRRRSDLRGDRAAGRIRRPASRISPDPRTARRCASRSSALDASVAPAGRRAADPRARAPASTSRWAARCWSPGARRSAAPRRSSVPASCSTAPSREPTGGPALARFRLAFHRKRATVPVSELPAADDLAPAILAAWRAAGAVPRPAEPDRLGGPKASGTYRTRFDDPEWTWRR